MNNLVQVGYACVNMTLTNRPKKLGGRVTTSRGCRKGSWHSTNDLHKLGELAVANAKDLLTYLQWNEEHGIRLFRLGSELVPWHDHIEFTDLPQYDELAHALRIAGDYATRHGHRITTHPGPFHVLGSPSQAVVDKTIIGLERHSQIFDLMGFDPSYYNKINIHIGGAYGNHELTAKRWIDNWYRLSDACKARLVVENDDKASMYSVIQLYDMFHRVIGIPITFDYFHHTFHTGGLSEREALELAGTTWPSDVVQCTHYSESRRNEYSNELQRLCERQGISFDEMKDWPTFRDMYAQYQKIKAPAHSDYIVNEINSYGNRIDVMVEAKAKELAVLQYKHKFENASVTSDLLTV
jgi:UV DNA damage endonuclease